MASKDGKLQFTRQASGDATLRMGDYGPPKPRLQDGLLFRRAADGSAKLVFGYTVNPGTATTPDATVGIDATFADDMRAVVRIAIPVSLGIDAGFTDDMACTIVADYDVNVDRPVLGRARPAWQDAQPQAATMRAHWQDSRPATAATRNRWQRAQPLQPATRVTWQASQLLARSARIQYQRAQPLTQPLRGVFQQAIALRTVRRQLWQLGQPLTHAERLAFQDTLKLHRATRNHWQRGQRLGSWWALHNLPAQPAHTAWRPRWQEAMLPPPGASVPPPPPDPERDPCYCPDTLGQIIFRAPYMGDGRLLFVCRPCAEPPEPEPPGGLVVVPIRRVYVVINDLALARADDGTPIMADAFSLSLDADSWTCSWSATLPMWELDKIAPGAGGEPVDIIANVNGQAFRLLAESYTRDRAFATGRIRVQGRGRNALLDAPYMPAEARTNSSLSSAQQLMESALLINGVSNGWAIDFGITDWIVPADTWQLQATPMAAILDVASAVGAVVQPHRTDRVVRILPRYPAAPWDWAGLTPDIELPADAVQTEGLQWQAQPDYNRIHVSGTTADGILAQVTRELTAGDEPMPMATHPLITHADAARQRAIAELGTGGRIDTYRLRLPVLPETGVILPGLMLKYTEGAAHRLGVVRGVQLDWARPTLRQVITLETHP